MRAGRIKAVVAARTRSEIRDEMSVSTPEEIREAVVVLFDRVLQSRNLIARTRRALTAARGCLARAELLINNHEAGK